MLIVLLQHLT